MPSDLPLNTITLGSDFSLWICFYCLWESTYIWEFLVFAYCLSQDTILALTDMVPLDWNSSEASFDHFIGTLSRSFPGICWMPSSWLSCYLAGFDTEKHHYFYCIRAMLQTMTTAYHGDADLDHSAAALLARCVHREVTPHPSCLRKRRRLCLAHND